MELKDVKLTKHMKKVFRIAQQDCQMTQSACLVPEHLLIGCLDDGSFPIKEAKQKSGIDIDVLKNTFNPSPDNLSYEICEPLKIPICQSTKLVIEQAISYMRNYNQIYLNEGHVLKALIKTGQTEKLLTKEMNNTLLSVATVSRDMSLDLTGYKKPDTLYRKIRIVSNEDAERLILFINEEFGTRWTESIKHELRKQQPSIFIAEDQEERIVGFAAFDIHKPHYFGPMGVAKNNRAGGIGESLLHFCLDAMKNRGYKEIHIDNAGPIEFYENTCHAKVIPFMN
ncbi:GNAT family N-acetyltransferase [Mesobacillus boroniphilus]|uniref:GNAT family N-acetyltransferase n=1 Tax=Mesobacillus boroniphilus TaxID=308892 RepID=A0A944CLZ9_9BACI|nr:GNAT family N-acetyltransferase [Mesobacillus boroniphilus]MBS8264273.1 GNAT family N-acetyltransferase [Mesobacillus boroniphilus]